MERNVKKNGKGVLLNVKVNRTTAGIKVFLKSKVLADFFTRLAGGEEIQTIRSGNTQWAVTEGRKLSNEAFMMANCQEFPNIRFNAWGEGDLFLNIQEGIINASVLRAKELAEGVTFEFVGLFTDSSLNLWFDSIQKVIKKIYLDYIKPVDREVIITYRETKNEQFL